MAANPVRVAAAAALVGAAAAYDNGSRSRLPPMGWSSWVALGPGAQPPQFDFCDEFSVTQSIEALMALGLPQLGYTHVHLDDCWAGPRNASGFLTAEADHFPNTMKPVVDLAHKYGLAFGLYTCAGTETCVGGRPGSKDHWTQDAQLWAEWQVDWMKMDWCNTQGMTPAPTYAKMSAALNATGFPIVFNTCEWGLDAPWTWAPAVAQTWRIAGDHTGVWSSTKSVIASAAAIPAANNDGPYAWGDMDMLETGCGLGAGMNPLCAHANNKEANMTVTEWKTEFSMWAISASPLIFTSPVMNCTSNASAPTGVSCVPWISDVQREILTNTEVIAINQDVTPQGRPVKAGDLTVWARKLSDGSAAVALYNQEDAPATTLSVDFSSLGWPSGTSADVRDLWAHTDLGSFTDRYPSSGGVTVPPHGTHVVRITPSKRMVGGAAAAVA